MASLTPISHSSAAPPPSPTLKRIKLVTAACLEDIMKRKTMAPQELAKEIQKQRPGISYHVVFADRYYWAITDAVYQLGGEFKFKKLYGQVCSNLGATALQAAKGFAPDPYKAGTVRDIRGLIRSWVEERSPHSMQHYFCNGKRKAWKAGERPLLFINPGLENANSKGGWKPYKYARGTKWSLNKAAAAAYVKPSEELLNSAAALYKRQGRRGAANQGRMHADVVIAAFII